MNQQGGVEDREGTTGRRSLTPPKNKIQGNNPNVIFAPPGTIVSGKQSGNNDLE
jgi:hypothetical protein